MKVLDLKGHKFGRLTVLERAGSTKHGAAKWLCKCECGNEKVVNGEELRKGNVSSCGCLQKETATKHGMRQSRLYVIWCSVKARCYNPNYEHYSCYGSRGIAMCDEWRNDFAAFAKWAMANGYSDDLSIDRKDVNGNYEPSNCRWATQKAQNNNTRRNRYLTYNGETLTAMQWAEKVGINYSTLCTRLHRGWTIERALSTP